MTDIRNLQAVNAYRDATRVAERILQETNEGTANPKSINETGAPSFSELVSGSLDTSRKVGYQGEHVSTKALAKEAQLHDLIFSVSNAELTLNTVVAVRDKVINAYQDIVKMPI